MVQEHRVSRRSDSREWGEGQEMGVQVCRGQVLQGLLSAGEFRPHPLSAEETWKGLSRTSLTFRKVSGHAAGRRAGREEEGGQGQQASGASMVRGRGCSSLTGSAEEMAKWGGRKDVPEITLTGSGLTTRGREYRTGFLRDPTS